jgi:MoxR-like ATPase
VIATQNPVEHRGVNDLPEAQLDRFMLMLSPGYPSESDEKEMLRSRMRSDPLSSISPVIDASQFNALIDMVSTVRIADSVISYIVAICRATRNSKLLQVGASPRSTLQLMNLAKASALADGRDYVIPDDVKSFAINMLPHRISPATQPNEEIGISEWKRKCIAQILSQIRPPDL